MRDMDIRNGHNHKTQLPPTHSRNVERKREHGPAITINLPEACFIIMFMNSFKINLVLNDNSCQVLTVYYI